MANGHGGKRPNSGRRPRSAVLPPLPPPPKERAPPPPTPSQRMAQQERAVTVLPPAPAFDVLAQLEMLTKIAVNFVVEEMRKGAAADREVVAEWSERAASYAARLAPYRHPRLSAVRVRIERSPFENLSELTDEQLGAAIALLESLGAAAGDAGADEGGADAPGAGDPAGF